MAKNKLFNLTLIFFFVTINFLSFRVSLAQQQVPNLGELESAISGGPVGEFINTVKQIDIGLHTTTWLQFNEIHPRTIFNKIDSWFYDTTGTKLVSVLKPVGNLLVWIFSTLANLIRWGLSLL